jgi:hypothetical protein
MDDAINVPFQHVSTATPAGVVASRCQWLMMSLAVSMVESGAVVHYMM